MTNLPSGTVTFLFTDIESSTKLAHEYPDRWEDLQARHHAILQLACECNHGDVFQIIGDAFCVAFHNAKDGLAAAVQAQQKLKAEDWSGIPVKVRMGIHTGVAERNGNDYRGYLTLVKVQRVMSVAYGGQILLSNASAELLHGDLFGEITLRDMKEHRLKGLPDLERLWQAVAPNLQQGFPPLQSLKEIPNNLPAQLTAFIGREKEVKQIKKRLEINRLVTLTGPGGTGKTRLSLEVAASILETFKHGVWFVELASLTDPELIPQTILSKMGISEQPGKDSLEFLRTFIHDRTTLIVLDNCEHLIEGCARVVNSLMNTAPALRILASSREALGVPGEASYPVPTLSLPNIEHLPDIKQLSEYEAVGLFIDRALLVQPQFKVTTENAPVVAEICHRLDGIPLAIELAAARLRVLNAEQIASRLDDRFRLLTGWSRTGLPRQQTLRAMIDWSYTLLDEREATLFRRLSVFSGGCRLEAAEQVCADSDNNGILQAEILDLLSHLVEKSLVSAKDIGSIRRYSMLETTRQYAREKLEATGEAPHIRQKHAIFYANLSSRTEDELDNIRSVFRWCLHTGEAEPALKLARDFYFWEKHVREGLQLIAQVLAMKGAQEETRERGLVLYSAAALSILNQDFKTGKAYVNELFIVSHKLNNALMMWSQKFIDGVCTLGEGDYERAYNIFQTARSEKEGSADEDQFRYALCTLAIASCKLMFQKPDEAREYAEDAYKILAELGDSNYLVDSDTILGYIALEGKDLDLARTHFRRGIEVAISYSVQQRLGVIFAGLGGVALREGKLSEAANWFGIADMMVTTTGYHTRFFPEAISQRYLTELRSLLNPDVFQTAWQEGNSRVLEEAIAWALSEDRRE